MAIAPPAGATLLGADAGGFEDEDPRRAAGVRPRAEPAPSSREPTAVGGEFTYRFDPEWLEVEPSHIATERTYVEFQGRTAYGERSEFPFYVRAPTGRRATGCSPAS